MDEQRGWNLFYYLVELVGAGPGEGPRRALAQWRLGLLQLRRLRLRALSGLIRCLRQYWET